MAAEGAPENPDAAGMAIATGSSASAQSGATNRRNNRSSDDTDPIDTGRISPEPLNYVAVDAPDVAAIKALEKSTAKAVSNLDTKITTRKIFFRVSGTCKGNKVLLFLNVLVMAVLLASFGVWAMAGDDLGGHASVTGLCAAMMLLSLALENLSKVLTHHFTQLDCPVYAGMAHAAVFVPRAFLTTFIWYNATHSDREKDVHHAAEIISHEIVGSTIVPLLVFIPILCLRIVRFDWNEPETPYLLQGLDSHLRSGVHASRLVGCAFLALVAPSRVTGIGPKTTVFYIVNTILSLEMLSNILSACQRKYRTISEPQITSAPSYRDAVERARSRLYFAAILMMVTLIALTSVTAWKLDMHLVRAVERHHENKTRFPGAFIGLVLLPLLTDSAGLYHIYYAIQNREDANHMIVHCVAMARNNLVFGAVFASLSSLVFHQQFLVNSAFVFSLLSCLTIAIAASILRSEETAVNTAISMFLLLIGFMLVALTMPSDLSVALALLSN